MKESELYFKFLLHVIGSDGKADAAEIEFIENAMQEVGVSNEIKDIVQENINLIKNGKIIDGLDDVIEEIGLSNNPYFILNIFKDSFAIAASDSHICDKELAIIKKLASCLSPKADSAFENIKSWAMRTIALEEEGRLMLENVMKEGT